MGTGMGEAVIDDRGRIVIPREIREELGLRSNQKLWISTKGDELVLSPEIGPDEFASGLRGCVQGSKIKPENLKQIWSVNHPHR